MDGFYRFDYAGRAGGGAGAIAFVRGKVAGLDAFGGVYKGSYAEAAGGIIGKVEMSHPTGGPLVTGADLAPGETIIIPFRIGQDALAGHTIQLETPTGPVSVKLTLISGF